MFEFKLIRPALIAACLVAAPAMSFGQTVSGSAAAQLKADSRLSGISTSGAEEIIAELVARGFAEVETGRTLLGRVRIEAAAEGMTREIIVHQSSGEILSDMIRLTGSAAVDANAAVEAGLLNEAEEPAVGARAAFSGSANGGASIGGVSAGGGVSVGGGLGIGN